MVAMFSSKAKLKHQMPGRTYQLQVAALGLGVILLLALKSMFSGNDEAAMGKQQFVVSENTTPKLPVTISLDETGGISYYHCEGGGSDDDVVTLVLLHGARFTKEDWKNPPGILEDFCSRDIKHKLKVFAVNLPTKSDYRGLSDFLDSMVNESKISKPVSLVTPSASGKTMVTWAASSPGSLLQYINRWIPVAAIAVNSAKEEDIQKLESIRILAIHGDQDPAGRQSSERLKSLADATVLQQVGRHPCYFDSPKEFVDEVVKFIDSPSP